MPEVSDMELLRNYSQQGSEEAFAELVRQHVNLVYSAALRHVGIAAHAEEITQAVFVILARKSASLRPDTILDAWLYETTRLTALSFGRGERRRQLREQEAYMQSILQESTEVPAWNQLAPLLDDAMSRLGRKDREAVVLRFFKEKSLREVAAALKVTEAAAQSRVHRAVEKLRQFFTKRGVVLPVAVLTAAISTHSVQAAPVALAKSITAVAFAKGAAASGSTLTLIKGALKIMAWMKMKTAAVVSIAALLAAGTTTVIVKEIGLPSIRDSDPVWEMTPESLAKARPMVLVRPTHFHDAQGRAAGGTNGIVGGRWMGIQPMIAYAYGWPYSRMVIPLNAPRGQFDYLITVRDHPKERFQDEIRKQLGLIGRREIRETEVFLLKVKRPGAAGITVSDGTPLWAAKNPPRSWLDIHNAPISALAGNLERYLAKPVLDQTGLTDRYDTDLGWIQKGDYETDSKTLRNALLEQLGLQLVPDRESIAMLVVEKAKK